MIESAAQTGQPVFGASIAALVAEQGSASANWRRNMAGGRFASDDAADLVHILCGLHGLHPGLLDRSANHCPDSASAAWFRDAIRGFADERRALVALTVAVGPAPSTQGEDATTVALLGHARALDMLAVSERRGCALGVAAGFVLDWRPLRAGLERVAKRLSFDLPPCLLPLADETIGVLNVAGQDSAVCRAIHFGAFQLGLQQGGLWRLLEARHRARHS